jgi:hypothetical protein
MFTTPARPIDILTVFPELAAYAKGATRLHPRRGLPRAQESSVAGPMLWPVGEPWPTCRLSHLVDKAEDAAPAEPEPMVPVVQLRAADTAETRFPEGTDLLQVLWCPHHHRNLPGLLPGFTGPAAKVIWRAAGPLTEAITAPQATDDGSGFILEPCVVHPERIIEYPDIQDLPWPLESRVDEWEDGLGEEAGYDYRNDLSTAPGLKTGGWPYWPQTPKPADCDCGAGMSLLLAIPSSEHLQSWTPLEDRAHAAEPGYEAEFQNPTGFHGARDVLLIFVCQQDPLHDVLIVLE